MHPKMRSLLFWALLAFALYAIVTSPERTADVFSAFWDVITNAAGGISTFVKSLIS